MMLAGTPPRAGSVSGHGRGARAIPGRLASAVRERCEMKGRLVAFVGIFCISMLVVFGADAKDKKGEGEGGGKGRGGGGKDGTKAECIVFVDNEDDKNWGEGSEGSHVWLEGGQDCAIEGCCPNAGPWPQYRMTLHNLCYDSAVETEECLQDENPFSGYLFMNGYGRNAPYEGWKVQFWTCDCRNHAPGDGDFFFQIRGGTEVPQGKKSKVSVIKFLDAEDATLWVYYDENDDCDFPSETGCEPCLNEMETGCNPWTDDECIHPCWIERPIEDVSFVIVRTADLTYSSDDLGITCPDAPPCPPSP